MFILADDIEDNDDIEEIDDDADVTDDIEDDDDIDDLNDDDDDDVILVGEKRARGNHQTIIDSTFECVIHLLYDADETPTLESAKRARLEPTVPVRRSEPESSEFYLLLLITHHDN